MSVRSTGLFVSLLVCAIACDDSDDRIPLPPVQLEGSFLSYAAADDVEICESTVPTTEAWMEEVAIRLGIDPALLLPTTYYFVEPSLVDQMCADGFAACTQSDDGEVSIYSTQSTHEHELVHAIQSAAWPRRIPLLQEGLAEAFGPHTPPLYYPPPSAEAIDAAIENQSSLADDKSAYLLGHYLVYSMLTRYDAATFEQFWYATTRPTTAAEFRATFEQVFGESLEDMVAGVYGPICTIQICLGEPVAWEQGIWTTESPTSCGDSTEGVGGALWRSELVEITEPIPYDLSVSTHANNGQGVMVTSCENPCEQYVIRQGQSISTYLSAPGLYRVETIGDGDPGIRFEIRPSP